MKDIISYNELTKKLQTDQVCKEREGDKKAMEDYKLLLEKQEEGRRNHLKNLNIKQKEVINRNSKVIVSEKEKQMAILEKAGDEYQKEKEKK